MRYDKKIRLQKRIFTLLLIGGLVFYGTLKVLAGSWSQIFSNYGDAFKLTCKNSVNSVYASASTGGATSPYKNNIAMSVFDKNNVRKGTKGKYSTSTSSTSMTGVGFYRVYSCHGVYDQNMSMIANQIGHSTYK